MKKDKQKIIKKIGFGFAVTLVGAGSLFLAGCSGKINTIPYNWTDISSGSQMLNVFNGTETIKDTESKDMKGYVISIESSACPICRGFRDLSTKDWNYYSSHQKLHSNDYWTKWFNSRAKGNGVLNQYAANHNVFSVYVTGYSLEDESGFINNIDNKLWGWVYGLKSNQYLYSADSNYGNINLSKKISEFENVEKNNSSKLKNGILNNVWQTGTSSSYAYSYETYNKSDQKAETHSLGAPSSWTPGEFERNNNSVKRWIWLTQKEADSKNKAYAHSDTETKYTNGWNLITDQKNQNDSEETCYGDWPEEIFVANIPNQNGSGTIPYVAGYTMGKYNIDTFESLGKAITKNLTGIDGDIFNTSNNTTKTNNKIVSFYYTNVEILNEQKINQ